MQAPKGMCSARSENGVTVAATFRTEMCHNPRILLLSMASKRGKHALAFAAELQKARPLL